jgi:hypothetical protein|tara:strand:- start:6712 stop:7107 length:396 start_codon:yes stop_codon:yes gene_type:complete
MVQNIKTSGPFFTDSPKRLLEAANRGLTDIAMLAQGKIREQLKPGHGRVTGHLQRSVMGYVYKDLHARVDAGQKLYGANLIYAGWVEGVSQRNKSSRFKGYRMYRNVFRWLKKDPEEVRKLFERAIKEAFK